MLMDDLDVTECAAAFLFDADERGEASMRKDFRKWYGGFLDRDFSFEHENWVRTEKFLVGVYIFCDAEGKGALEQHIVPMVKSTWPKRFKDAHEFISENRQRRDKVFQPPTNKQKAVITCVGQFDFPGDSIFSIINESNGIPDSKFETSDACLKLVNFLQKVPWAGN